MIRFTDEQEEAARQEEGQVRVLAGAGTGKTAVVAERCRRLIARGEDPGSILVVTFSERAAAEMGERIEAQLEASARPITGTFHAVALSWLRESRALPSGSRILAGAERWMLMRELLWRQADPALVSLDHPDQMVAPILRLMERLKQELLTPRHLQDWARATRDPEERATYSAVGRLHRAYAARCREERLIDFDELIARCVDLAETQPEFLAGLRQRFRWIMVDEYQDVNPAQEILVHQVAGSDGNLFVVGDDDQSIYRFRGASRASLARFVELYPRARTVVLRHNHRSRDPIVAGSARLMSHSAERFEKEVVSARGEGPPITAAKHETGENEAAGLVHRIVSAAMTGIDLSRIGVLIRSRVMAHSVIQALEKEDVPYQVWGGRGFFDRPEIRDLVGYLRFLDRPSDEVAAARILVRPPLNLDQDLALSRLASARAARTPILRSLSSWPPTRAWASTMSELLEMTERLGVDELFFELMSKLEYLDRLPAGEAQSRQVQSNVARFAEMIDEHCSRSPDQRLAAFLGRLELVLLSGEDDQIPAAPSPDSAVQVMTMHQAKGLEFDVVLIPGMVEGRIPHLHREDRLPLPSPSAGSGEAKEDHLAEERRLAYVAMTRARDQLHLSCASRYEGARPWKPSRFFDEMGLDPKPSSSAAPRTPGVGRESVPESVPEHGASPIALSFSSIAAYRECPRQYWFRYVKGVRVQPTPEAEFGTVIHETLRSAGELRRGGSIVDAAVLDRLQETAWKGHAVEEPGRQRAFVTVGRRLLHGYLRAGGLDPVPHLLECAIEARFPGWRLRGVIDRIDPPKAPGAPWRLVDYKTGSPQPKSELRRDLQLALYALGAEAALGLEVTELRLVYLKTGQTVDVAADDELRRSAREVGERVAAGVSRGEFPARPQVRRCSLCPYRLACPEAW